MKVAEKRLNDLSFNSFYQLEKIQNLFTNYKDYKTISLLIFTFLFYTPVLFCFNSVMMYTTSLTFLLHRGSTNTALSCCFPLLILSSPHIRHWGLNCQVRMTEISSCHHLPTAPCVYQPCVLPWTGDHNTNFYIKRDMDKALDSTQDVRLEAWHCFPQTMKCAYVV